MSAAQYAYDETPIGKDGRIVNAEDLAAFQAQVHRLDKMEHEGLIRIKTRHSESQTGHHLVDFVVFTRVR